MYATALFFVCLLSFLKGAVIEGTGLLNDKSSSYREYETALRVKQYLRLGMDLPLSAGAVMTSEIGGLGWTYRGRIIDAAGLVSPECLKYHPMKVPEQRGRGIYGAIPVEAVVDLKPGLVVSMEVFSESFRREFAFGSLTDYELIERYPVFNPEDVKDNRHAVLWGSRYIEVYARKGATRK